MTTITLTPLWHQNADQIAIVFDYNIHVKTHIESLEGVQWSDILNIFYISQNAKSKQRLYQHLRQNQYYVDYSALQAPSLRAPIKPSPLKPDLHGMLTQTHHDALYNFKNYLLQKRYSGNTITTYAGVLTIFFRFYALKDIESVTEEDIVIFNQDYILRNGYGRTFQNQIISALKLFYTYYSNTQLNINQIERPKKDKRLPEILSKEEVKTLLINIKNTKHRTILSLVYACGMRIGEALSLKIDAIDGTRGFIHIKHAKGAKDRYVPLSDKTLALLRYYYKLHKPLIYLFEGLNGGMYSQESCRKILQNALKSTGIRKHVTLHTLRHSYATHLLECGTDLRYIQDILGHNSPKTTMIYTHVSQGSLKKIKNPFDDMDI